MAETTVARTHTYFAEAKALHGELHRPFKQSIMPQALVQLHPEGGYLDQHGESFGAERLLMYDGAYTHVSGSLETKPGGGWCTLSTCAVENLNILDVVTADRIVSQVFTEHPLVGYVPRISFLATRFENLRIAGHTVDLELDLNILGGKPENDAAYSRHPKLLDSLRAHSERIRGYDGLPRAAHERYNQVPKKILETTESQETEIIECSLVTKAGGNFPGRSYGHVVHVPDFGDIYLATVKVIHEDFHHGVPHKTTVELKMLEAKMGCAATGTADVGTTITNGPTKP